MNIGDLVRLRRNDSLWIVFDICPRGNIGLWNSSLRAGIYRWTYAGALRMVEGGTKNGDLSGMQNTPQRGII